MIGTTLSHYKIVSEIGRGGMGIVYKAEDTKLDRTVAIKVLPSAAIASEDDRARFYREAKAAAQLHHPNIASVFQIDEAAPSNAPHGTEPSPFIAMEYIDGDTLTQRIAQGPLKIKDAVRIAGDVASALEAAHENNIVHRDVKSGNVMLTAKGTAKVLDFGLAKTEQSTMLTKLGSTVGTIGYMSPEQARGEEVDHRTDIWALGVVLFEVLTGRHPFPGEYEQAVVYSILNADPEPLTALRTGVPMELERIVNKLLAKDRDRRYQSIAGFRADLLGVDTGESSISQSSRLVASTTQLGGQKPTTLPEEQHAKPINPILAGVILGLVLLAGLAIGKWVLGAGSSANETAVVRRLSTNFDGLSSMDHPSVSKDGKLLVFSAADSSGNPNIYIYDFAEGDFVASYPNSGFQYFKFSPDNRWLAMSGIGVGITTIRLPDGNPQVVTTQGEWGVWESDESMLMRLNSNLYRISASGGDPELVALPDSTLGLNRLWPTDVILDKGIALIAGAGAGEFDRGIFALDLETSEYELVIDKAHGAVYLDSGHLMYLQGGGLVGQLVVRTFDIDSKQAYGIPATLNVDQLNWLSWGVGRDGTVVYSGESTVGQENHTWIDIDGRSLGSLSLPDGRFGGIRFSSQGDRIAVMTLDYNDFAGDIWVFDVLGDRSPVRLTDSQLITAPAWSPSGSTVYFSNIGQSGTTTTIQSVSADGSTGVNSIIRLENNDVRWLTAFPDGSHLLYSDRISDDLYRLSLDDTTIVRITNTPNITELDPALSPDGRFVAFHDVDQPRSRIIIAELEGQGQWEISDSGQTLRRPKWSADGQYLFFVNTSGVVYRHRISLEPTFIPIGQPEPIMRFPASLPSIAVHPDGQRLLVSSSSVIQEESQRLNFIFSFKEEAKRIAPTR